MSEQHTYKFDVKMDCSGCSGAVTRVLEKAKADGVTEYTVDLKTQEVLVTALFLTTTFSPGLRRRVKRSGTTLE
ncbi:hypothetical protein M413DRAFT_95620 [Hebeloma cylindrosporum]|uniref:HMA domain-containing protein n=1 Tax=Hebeloma cylindrosporum TaxID=76867 RepID=A0A0C2Z7L2_HEBCY|nr:hypothetical protein M413DRAFT_95620 [Hebeloma cylindrosporum h7]